MKPRLNKLELNQETLRNLSNKPAVGELTPVILTLPPTFCLCPRADR